MNHLSKHADQIIQLAKKYAHEYGQGYVGTEHLLLGIVHEPAGQAARILSQQGVTEDRVRDEIDRLVQNRLEETWVLGRLPGTPHFKDVIAKAAHYSRGRGNWQICSVHLLLALLDEKGSMGCEALRALGVSSELIQRALVQEPALS